MAKFLLYLFESGLCLTLFYLGYVVFFRKETYFNFNRFYLLVSMVLALLMPLVPIQVDADETEYIGEAITQVEAFRNYYEEFVYYFDAEYDAPTVSNPGQMEAQNSLVNKVSSSVNIIKTLFIFYFVGLLFFFLRLVILFFNLFRFVHKNKTCVNKGFAVVYLKDEVPSFSFLKWIFVNKEMLKPHEFEQVLAHEKVHVQHKHSVDLVLAHIITMFQWFNPLTWRIQKSIKTCHEYIADRQVLNQGHELFDYQSLLLSQLISIRSVELVNNFNLLSIKKRIAMMNKIKSGRIAKLKAVLVIPIISLAFIFFANCTESFNDSKNDSEANLKSVALVNVPSASEVKDYDNNFVLCRLTLSKYDFFCDGIKKDLSNVDQILADIRQSADQSKVRKMSVLLEVDNTATMNRVDVVRQAMRNQDLLKIGYVTKKSGEEKALFMLLPPKDAMIIEDESKIKTLYIIDHKEDMNIQTISKDLTEYVYDHDKYVMLYKYNNETTYDDYLKVVDMVFHSINNIRRAEAKKEGKNFDSMEKQEQKAYRRKYPITLSQRNIDIE